MLFDNTIDMNKVIKNINESLSALLIKDGDQYRPKVCFSCDRMLMEPTTRYLELEQVENNKKHFMPTVSVSKKIHDDYTFCLRKNTWIEELMISPRTFFKKNKGFLVCEDCKYSITHNRFPKYTIANGWFVGSTPSILDELNEVELALIAPVRTHGHIITYFGGEKGI